MAHITYITHIINIIAGFTKKLNEFCIFTIYTICKEKIYRVLIVQYDTSIIVQNRNYLSTIL